MKKIDKAVLVLIKALVLGSWAVLSLALSHHVVDALGVWTTVFISVVIGIILLVAIDQIQGE